MIICNLITIYLLTPINKLIELFNPIHETFDAYQAFSLCGQFALLMVTKSFLNNHAWRLNYRIGVRSMQMILVLVFNKLHKISIREKRKMNFGKFINMISMDSEHVINFLRESYSIIIIPLMSCIISYQIIRKLKLLGVIAIFSLFLQTYLIQKISKLASKYLKKNFVISDKRNKLINSALLGIKSVKFNGLEPQLE